MLMKMTCQNEERCDVLGVGISPTSLPAAVRTVQGWIARLQRHYVCVTGMHGVIECQRDEELKRIHNGAGMVTPDGMPMVWLSKLCGFSQTQRVYGPDLMLEICAASVAAGHRHFFYGGNEGIADLLAEQLRKKFPGIQIVGTFCPPFRKLTDEEDRNLINVINACSPDIVWVGLSTPKQERWMASHRAHLNASTLIGVGAAFDFHAGIKKQAPKWMQKNGLEWLFRLLSEPRRLWKRYCLGIPQFLWYLLLQSLRLKNFDVEPDSAQEFASV